MSSVVSHYYVEGWQHGIQTDTNRLTCFSSCCILAASAALSFANFLSVTLNIKAKDYTTLKIILS